MNFSILIAIEDYSAGDIKRVLFAQNDVEAFAEALNAVGYKHSNQQVLINEAATKTSIESVLQTTIESLTADDSLIFYYAGHGFCDATSNYLTCHDTRRSDLARTSVQIQWIFDLFNKSDCNKVAMFLDACHSGALASEDMRDIVGELTESELQKFFDGSEHCVCFASCRTGQKSFASRPNKHGAWTFNVLEAFRGNELTALRGSMLTANSLQDHLATAVQRTLRLDSSDPRAQTPWKFGASSNDFLLADLRELLASKQQAANPNAQQLTRVSFVGETREYVRSLSGFKSSHHVPKEYGDYTENWVREKAEKEIEEDLESVFQLLSDEFEFLRKDLEKGGPEFGGGSIICPHFTYNVQFDLNPDDPSEVIISREVTDIKEPDKIETEEFSNVFDSVFDTIEYSPPTSITVENFVDLVQPISRNDNRLEVKFDSDCTYCILKISGIESAIKVTSSGISIVDKQVRDPQDLIASFHQAQRALVDQFDVRTIGFNESNSANAIELAEEE